jgi:prepilin-type N-terminal cleavage/methylation domain-containing protein
MKNEHGFTLIEAIISLAILSVIIIGFTSAFSQGYFLIGEGRDLTEETFKYQEQMEMNMVDVKNQFIEGEMDSPDTTITVFQGSDYETDISLISITEDIRGNRAFQAYVSNVEIGKPEPPQVDLNVGVYANNNWVDEVFPWIDDDIQLRATYTIDDEPPVFLNTSRWYQSNDGNLNPYFPSGFNVISEETVEEPEGNYTSTLSDEDLIESYFYQFEISPYTFAGRLGQFTHEERIPVIKRAGSSYWQDFIEDVYSGQATIFNSSIYTDVLLHADHPTLNVDWESNNDPGGSLIGMAVPNDYQRLPFESTISFEVDDAVLAKGLSDHGLGVSLINASNTGLMATLDINKNTLRLSNINNGSYASTIGTYHLLTDARFSDFIVSEGGSLTFDWQAIKGLTYKVYRRYNEENDEVEGPFLSITLNGLAKESDPVEVPYNLGVYPQYVGFKSYSSEDYYPDQTEEIIGKYDRNFAAHFYDVTFEKLDDDVIPVIPDNWYDGGNNGFYAGNSSNITGNSRPLLNIEMNRGNSTLNGNRQAIEANSFLFSSDMNLLTIGNNHSLNVKVNNMVIFDTPIEFKNNAEGIDISGIGNNSYPIYVLFRGNGRHTFDQYSISGDYDHIQVNNMDVLQINSGSININD